MDRMQVGRLGEGEAVRYLESRGWTILGRNVRLGRREIDIIALRGPILAFVEVKCRRGQGFGHPLDAITGAKRREVVRAARAWLLETALPPGTSVRFDAVSVLCPPGRAPEVLHLPDAWRPG